MIHAIRRKIPVSDSVLLRLTIFVGLIVTLLGVGVAAPRVPPELVLIAVLAPPILLLALNQRAYGALGIILTAAFVRFSLSTGTQSRIVASLLVTLLFVALWLAKMLAVDRRLHLKPSRTNVPLLAFVLTAVISYVWGNAFRDPLVVVWGSWPFVQLGALAVIVLLPGAFILTANTISDVRWLKLLCWSFVLVGALSLASYSLHLGLSFLNTWGLFSLWFVCLTYAQALFNRKLPIWLRLALFGMAVVWMYIYFIRRVTWLSGWLPPLAAIAAVSLLKSRRLFLLLVLLVIIYVGLNWDYYAGDVLAAETAESGHSRLAAWEHNWRVTKEHLLFGTGPAGYAAYYMSYFPSEAMATHSNYIDILSQMGIVGLFFCLWFLGALGWTGFRLYLRLRGHADFSEGLVSATLAGWLGCVVAMGLGDWMLPFAYTQTIAGFDYAVYNWVLLGALAALDSIHQERSGQ